MANLTNEELRQAQNAHATLVREVFLPVFLEKLASDFGIVPQNNEEVASLLDTAARLGEAHAAQAVKEASAQTNFFNNDYSVIKAAAHNLANRDDLVDAVLTYHGAIVKQADEPSMWTRGMDAAKALPGQIAALPGQAMDAYSGLHPTARAGILGGIGGAGVGALGNAAFGSRKKSLLRRLLAGGLVGGGAGAAGLAGTQALGGVSMRDIEDELGYQKGTHKADGYPFTGLDPAGFPIGAGTIGA